MGQVLPVYSQNEGGMVEWLKAATLEVVNVSSIRGFESPSLRHPTIPVH